ncbi:MAG: response regulator [Lachnospiraceae bacterium]|nr:response regulator [Lachnospiraceae bacterium]
MAAAILLVVFFVGIISLYYRMLFTETRENIIQNGRLNAIQSAQQIDRHLSTSIDIIRIASYTLDNMIRDGRSSAEMLDYLENQTIAVTDTLIDDSTGIYGYINGEYMDGSGWMPDADYVATDRPWYIQARANRGRITVVDPYVDQETSKVMISLAKTLCDTKSVVAIDFSMDELQSITEELAGAKASSAEIVLNGKGIVIAHSDKSQIGMDYSNETGTLGAEIIRRINAADDRFFYLSYGGADYMVYIAPLENDWLSISVIDATDNFRRLRMPLFLTIFTSIFMVSVILFLSIRSERKSREANLLALKSERATAANDAKTSFLSNMSHEIRTPITAILGMNEMILRESKDNNILSYAENIHHAGTTLLGIVNDILDFSKIEAGKLEIIPVDYNFASLINDLLNMVRERAEDKGLALVVHVDSNLPKELHGDEIRIKQVITNLLTNAVKYTNEGSISFDIGFTRPEEGLDEVMLDIAVSDTGIGIKEEDMEKLFSKFDRIEEKRNRSIEGTGLGLSITSVLLNLMGSNLQVESVYNKGSKFYFSLRQQVVKWDCIGDFDAAYQNAYSQHSQYQEQFIAPTAQVLVVDDTPLNLEVFTNLLKQTQMSIDTVDSGFGAIKKTKLKKYDVIFLDHMMPEKDGIETLQEIRKDPDNPNLHTPTLCLTANAISGAKDVYVQAGFDDYISKPINPVKLEEMLIRYLPEEKVERVAGVKAAEEEAVIPPFIFAIEELDTNQGLTHCGSVKAYLQTLIPYAEMAGKSADEIEACIESGDIQNATIKIHSLKSTSRLIGASDLGDLAQVLEDAGKAGDVEKLKGGIGDFLRRIRFLGDLLLKLKEEEERSRRTLPEISLDELHDRFAQISMNLEEWQTDEALEMVEDLKNYRIPEAEAERVKGLILAADNFDYDQMTMFCSGLPMA